MRENPRLVDRTKRRSFCRRRPLLRRYIIIVYVCVCVYGVYSSEKHTTNAESMWLFVLANRFRRVRERAPIETCCETRRLTAVDVFDNIHHTRRTH